MYIDIHMRMYIHVYIYIYIYICIYIYIGICRGKTENGYSRSGESNGKEPWKRWDYRTVGA